MIALWILAGIGLYYVTMGFVFLFCEEEAICQVWQFASYGDFDRHQSAGIRL